MSEDTDLEVAAEKVRENAKGVANQIKRIREKLPHLSRARRTARRVARREERQKRKGEH